MKTVDELMKATFNQILVFEGPAQKPWALTAAGTLGEYLRDGDKLFVSISMRQSL